MNKKNKNNILTYREKKRDNKFVMKIKQIIFE
jgi:hypothetical protein